PQSRRCRDGRTVEFDGRLCADRPAMENRPQPLVVHEAGAQGSGWAMKIHPSLMFSGTCGDAFRRYASLFGGEIVFLLTYAESPLAQQVPPEWRGKGWVGGL